MTNSDRRSRDRDRTSPSAVRDALRRTRQCRAMGTESLRRHPGGLPFGDAEAERFGVHRETV